ncbi:GAF domain-containing protein [Parasalinivibrio latis]|uniref:PelD GGDEF domain-containing protein n=1 Tax=Parasalinivibrio latis TaxID=2952610 RepID=UPI0030DEE7E4
MKSSIFSSSRLSTLKNRIFAVPEKNGVVWFETILFAVLALVIWVCSEGFDNPEVSVGFFWPIVGPLVIALRYGFAQGLICAVLTVAGVEVSLLVIQPTANFPFSLSIGTVVVTMAAGEFRDHWEAVNTKYALNYEYMNQKLESFTQNYHLLKVSHDQLEKRTAGQAISLRTSIQSLQRIAVNHAEHRLDVLAGDFLNLFSDIIGMHVAGIYAVVNGEIDSNAKAVIGDNHYLDHSDPMLAASLSTGELLSPAELDDKSLHNSRYQLCVPLKDTKGTVHAILACESVQFIALNPTNIALLALVANYAANLLSDSIVAPVLKPQQRDLFISYLNKVKGNKQKFGADSALVVFTDVNGEMQNILESLIDYRRGADIYWSCYTLDGMPALAVLLPMTSVYEAQQFVNRVKELVDSHLNSDFSDISVSGPFSIIEQHENAERVLTLLGANHDAMADFSNSPV